MKNIILFSYLIVLLLSVSAISAVDSSDWKVITIEDHNFKIPPTYQDGVLEDDGSSFEIDGGATFALYCIDGFVEKNYGYAASSSYNREDLTIGSHEVVFFSKENSVSRAYFSCGDSIFYIGWEGQSMTPEIEEIIRTSDDSTLSSDEFHGILDTAEKIHDDREFQDLTSNSYRYPLVNTESQQEDSSYLVNYYNYYRHVYD